MAQDIGMQIERLEEVLDKLYKATSNNLGVKHPIAMQSLKATIYLQGLKYDWKALKKAEDAINPVG